MSQAQHPTLKPLLEYGPLVAFLVTYLIFRNATFTLGGTSYSGLIAITAAFIPVFAAASYALWRLTGRVTRVQLGLAAMLVIFGGLSLWMNDDRLIKMKPTAIYLILTAILVTGLLRGQSWLKYILEDMIPLKKKGWMILTRRTTVVFALAAIANEVVWRTQSDAIWVLFEAVVMPILILLFFVSQFSVFVTYGRLRRADDVKERTPNRAKRTGQPARNKAKGRA
ncbi:MAG: septation protein IspZ [Pseudomonadota bacterium]